MMLHYLMAGLQFNLTPSITIDTSYEYTKLKYKNIYNNVKADIGTWVLVIVSKLFFII